MKTFIHKTTSCGMSWRVASRQPSLKLGHFLYQPLVPLERLAAQGYRSMLVCEVALVQHFEAPAQQEQIPSYVVVTHQRLADVIDLSAHILTFGIREKQDLAGVKGPGRDVEQLPSWTLPNGMELCLDEHAPRLPNTPAVQLFAAMGSHLLWHDAETLFHWLAKQGRVLDEFGRSARHHAGAESQGVGR
jgi:hypothetical protein